MFCAQIVFHDLVIVFNDLVRVFNDLMFCVPWRFSGNKIGWIFKRLNREKKKACCDSLKTRRLGAIGGNKKACCNWLFKMYKIQQKGSNRAPCWLSSCSLFTKRMGFNSVLGKQYLDRIMYEEYTYGIFLSHCLKPISVKRVHFFQNRYDRH